MIYKDFGRCVVLLLWAVSSRLSADDRALLIGINRYEFVNKLKGTHNDVRALRNMLTTQLDFADDAIRELKDEQATKVGILQAIDEWLVQSSGPGDRVVLYYSGHGGQIEDRNYDEADGQDEALIAYDARDYGVNWVLDDEIAERMARLRDRQSLAVFDSCHSGSATRGFYDAEEDAKIPDWDMTTSGSRGAPDSVHQREGGFIEGEANPIAYFAVAPNQLAREDKTSEPNRPHGVFTDAFVLGVAGAADFNQDGQVSYAELLEFTRRRSAWYCENVMENCRRSQLTPVLEMDAGSQAGDIRSFGRYSLTPAGPAQTASALLPHGNDAHLELKIEPGNRLRLGETVRYSLETHRSGKLVIFDIDPLGRMTRLFPNAYLPQRISGPCSRASAQDLVRAGSRLLIPDDCMGFTFVAQEPTGKGKVVALLIEDISIDTTDLPVSADLGGLKRSEDETTHGKSSFTEIAQPRTWLEHFRYRLNQVFHQADGFNRAINWSITAIDYEILP